MDNSSKRSKTYLALHRWFHPGRWTTPPHSVRHQWPQLYKPSMSLGFLQNQTKSEGLATTLTVWSRHSRNATAWVPKLISSADCKKKLLPGEASSAAQSENFYPSLACCNMQQRSLDQDGHLFTGLFYLHLTSILKPAYASIENSGQVWNGGSSWQQHGMAYLFLPSWRLKTDVAIRVVEHLVLENGFSCSGTAPWPQFPLL